MGLSALRRPPTLRRRSGTASPVLPCLCRAALRGPSTAGLLLIGERRGADIASPSPRYRGSAVAPFKDCSPTPAFPRQQRYPLSAYINADRTIPKKDAAMLAVAAQPIARSGPLTMNRPITLRSLVITIITAITGAATTPLITALQKRALMVVMGENFIAVPSMVATAMVA